MNYEPNKLCGGFLLYRLTGGSSLSNNKQVSGLQGDIALLSLSLSSSLAIDEHKALRRRKTKLMLNRWYKKKSTYLPIADTEVILESKSKHDFPLLMGAGLLVNGNPVLEWKTIEVALSKDFLNCACSVGDGTS